MVNLKELNLVQWVKYEINLGHLLKKYKVDEAIGGFRCNLPNYKSWGVLIEPLGEHKIDSNVYTSRIMVTLKTEIMPSSDITSFYFKHQVQKDIEQSKQRALNEKYQSQEKAKQQTYNNFLNSNKPTSKNIGSKVCKDVTTIFLQILSRSTTI